MLRKLYNKAWFVKAVFYLSAAIVLVIGIIAFKSMKDLSETSDLVTSTYEINVELEQILSYLKDAETGYRGYLISQDSLFLDPYLKSRENINNSFALLKQLTKDNTVHQENLRELNKLIDLKIEIFQKSADYADMYGIESTMFRESLLRGEVIMDAIRENITKMIGQENAKLRRLQEAYKSSLNLTPKFLYSVLFLSLLVMFAAYSKIVSNLKRIKIANEQLELFKVSTNQAEIVSQHGSWIYNIDNNTYQYSDNLYRLLGEEPQSFVSTLENFMKYVHPDDVEKLKEEVAKMVVEENLPYIYYRIIRKDNDIRHFKAYGKTLINSEGNRRLLGTTTDISDEIENLRILEERNFELERNNKELSAFNHVASHDLQEPLRKIQTFLSRLEEKEAKNFSENSKLYIERIKSAASRMRLLIDDLLQYSRTNKSEKVLEVSNLNELLEDAEQDLAELIDETDAIIEADNFPKIKVIPFQIKQLFVNLMGNALKYKHADRVPKIQIKYSKIKTESDKRLMKGRSRHYHKIVFTDNGIGFNNAYSEKIFILFNRLHNKDDYTGTGIGLSICKKIVENHKGYIFGEGRPQEGATFTVFLPE